MNIAENIRKYRKMYHMEQQDLAYQLHISDKTVSSWECGRTEPRMGMIEAMCEIFRCDKSELIDGEPTQSKTMNLSNVERDIILSYRNAEPGIKNSVLKLLDIEKRDTDISDVSNEVTA